MTLEPESEWKVSGDLREIKGHHVLDLRANGTHMVKWEDWSLVLETRWLCKDAL